MAAANARAVVAEQIRHIDARVIKLEQEIRPIETLAATSSVRLEHIAKTVDSLLSTVRWVALFVMGGVLAAVLNLVIKSGGG